MASWSVRDKTVLITGGNSGIGLATAEALANQGAKVVITSRDPKKGERARADLARKTGASVACVKLDLASFDSIESGAEAFKAKHERLDVLINNAGLVLTERSETDEGFETTLGVNHVGHFLLTERLLPLLTQGQPARIINVASDAHKGARRGLDFDDLQSLSRYRGMDVYCKSKLANIYYTRELAKRLAGTKVTANCLHPGVVSTGFARDGDAKGFFGAVVKLASPFMLNAQDGAKTTIHLATADSLTDVSGEYFAKCNKTAPSRVAQDAAAAERLWQLTERWVNDRHP